MSTRPYKDYKVNELKELLKQRELSVSGTKPELIARLEESDEQGEAAEEAAEPAAAEPQVQTEEAPEPVAEPAAEAAAAPVEEPAPETVVETVVETAPTEPATTDATEAAPQEEVDPVKRVVADIEKKIAEEKAAGNSTEELEKRLKRIHRFGAASIVDSSSKAKFNGHHRGRGVRNNNRRGNSAGVSK